MRESAVTGWRPALAVFLAVGFSGPRLLKVKAIRWIQSEGKR
jgi:hypothetical protein